MASESEPWIASRSAIRWFVSYLVIGVILAFASIVTYGATRSQGCTAMACGSTGYPVGAAPEVTAMLALSIALLLLGLAGRITAFVVRHRG